MRQCHTQGTFIVLIYTLVWLTLFLVGWMHNRVRMVAAMFLTKHLMLDWRLGERYFMQSKNLLSYYLFRF